MLKHIGELRGEADLSDVLVPYKEWYKRKKREFGAQPNPALALAYFNRHRGHVLKLAVIFEVSTSGRLKVSKAAWQRAVKFAEQIEQTIFALFPTGMSAAGYDLQKIEERIRRAGPTGITRNELTRCFQSMNPRDREQSLKTLTEASRIHVRVESTVGRPKSWYSHADFHQIEG